MNANPKLFDGKVFGVGFHKTGTTSLHIFLKLMGYHGIHWPDRVKGVHYQKLCIPKLHDAKQIVDVLLPVFSQYETFTDVPIPALYRELDNHFSGSRFILVERNNEDWWESMIKHWHLQKKEKRILDPYEYLQYNYGETVPLSEITMDSKKEVIQRYNNHIERVKDYFHGRLDTFLAISIADPDKAKKIAEFLQSSEVPIYPKLSRTSSSGPPSLRNWQ